MTYTDHMTKKQSNISCKSIESASSPLVGFEWLNDNVIKGLTRLLSVDM